MGDDDAAVVERANNEWRARKRRAGCLPPASRAGDNRCGQPPLHGKMANCAASTIIPPIMTRSEWSTRREHRRRAQERRRRNSRRQPANATAPTTPTAPTTHGTRQAATRTKRQHRTTSTNNDNAQHANGQRQTVIFSSTD